jgi:hypothetical protein
LNWQDTTSAGQQSTGQEVGYGHVTDLTTCPDGTRSRPSSSSTPATPFQIEKSSVSRGLASDAAALGQDSQVQGFSTFDLNGLVSHPCISEFLATGSNDPG